MKFVLLFALFALGAAWPHIDYSSHYQKDGGVSGIEKQEVVLKLLHKVYEPLPSKWTRMHDAAENYNPAKDGSFKDGGDAAALLSKEIDDHRVAARKHWFSLFNTRQREEALMLFNVLMNANDFETFASSACYYRERMNEGEFVYALYVAVIHSGLAQEVTLPPLYEVTPHMFTNSEIIQQAYSAKMRQTPGTFKMDFTGTQRNPEQRVAYFGEDIGLNVHHVTWHMDFPFWWQDSYGYHLDRKGELFFWAHHQLTVRFDAERLSNNLDVVDELYWDRPIHEGFAPHTSYKYGGEFPSRPDEISFEDVDGVARIRDLMIMESRIRDAIAHGYAVAKDGSKIDIRNEHGIDVLGDIIESSLYSPNTEYYGALHNLAHIVLGRQGDPHGKFGMPPGVMEHFETATRDPSFFRLHKYMDNIFKEHKDSLPPYTAEELDFPGVSIEDVKIEGPLETYFEDFEFDLTNAVDNAEGVEDVPISAKVNRLAHKPFSASMEVSNNNGNDVLATVRAYLCPTYDYNGIRQSFDAGRWTCIEMDKFWVKLAPGKNTVSRNSADSAATVPDVPSFKTLIEKTKAGELLPNTRSCGIPNRLLLPKGKPEGMTFTLAVAVTDGEADAAVEGLADGEHGGTHAQCGVHGEKYPDNRPLGYPLDRRIPDDRVYMDTTNFFSTHVTVTHKE